MTSKVLQSMTAYGYGELAQGGLTYTTEIRTLNSRYLEVNVRLPRPLLALELDVINHVKATLRRGKVDVFIDMVREGGAKDLPQLDRDVLAHYLRVAVEVKAQLPADAPKSFPTIAELMRLEGVLSSDGRPRARGQEAAEAHRDAMFKAVDDALKAVINARKKEGEALHKALLDLTTLLEQGREQVLAKRELILPNIHKNYVKRLENLVATLQKSGTPVGTDLPEDRLLSEASVMVDKADIEEELTRLKAHIDEFRRVMREEEAAGRKLDFICQEMHREVNTMSNKLVQTDVAQITLEMKQNVERIRQQVQNIE